jgi:hypothetical protein
VSIRASINKGLSDELKAAFPNTIPTPRPEVEESLINHPWWVAGFTEGEGCFYIVITQSPESKNGFTISLGFQVTRGCRRHPTLA